MSENTDSRSPEEIRVAYQSFIRLLKLLILSLDPLDRLGEPHFIELAKDDYIHLPITDKGIIELLDSAEDQSSDTSDFMICMQEVGSLFGFGLDINPNIQYDEEDLESKEAKYILSIHSCNDETFEEMPTEVHVDDKPMSIGEIELVLSSSWQRPNASWN